VEGGVVGEVGVNQGREEEQEREEEEFARHAGSVTGKTGAY
jgi:hypothetical protein